MISSCDDAYEYKCNNNDYHNNNNYLNNNNHNNNNNDLVKGKKRGPPNPTLNLLLSPIRPPKTIIVDIFL